MRGTEFMPRIFTERSRQLRREQTPNEQKLWSLLRDRRLEGWKFRRQYEIGYYIVDFCCVAKKFIIELDGGGHAEEIAECKDQGRDTYLRQCGYTVVRIWNSELQANPDGVLLHIIELLTTPHPNPLP